MYSGQCQNIYGPDSTSIIPAMKACIYSWPLHYINLDIKQICILYISIQVPMLSNENTLKGEFWGHLEMKNKYH